jgi:hypothetical protein
MLSNTKNRQATDNTMNLTLDELVDILIEQGGRCYYSNIVLQFSSDVKDWKISLERKNPFRDTQSPTYV